MIGGTILHHRCDTKKLGITLDRVAGVVRKGDSMRSMLIELQQEENSDSSYVSSIQGYNACQLAELVLKAALLRCESRGTHYREDYPEKKDADFSKHVVQQWGKGSVLHEQVSIR